MKNLSLISFVGVDEHTKLEDLLSFDKKLCEFSVLFSDSKSLENNDRYPSYKFCKEFLDWAQTNNFKGSLHLCGSVIDRYLKQDTDVIDLCNSAYRIQLNLNIKNYPDYEKLSDNILLVLSQNKHDIILQQNKTKKKFMEIMLPKTFVPINLLHDSSGGFGREITQVDPPHNFHFTGYAGGIKPDNVNKIVDLIEKRNVTCRPYYIDMESGIRTDNIFSIDKCKEVVQNIL